MDHACPEPRRVVLNRDARRDAILDAAEALFLEAGFDKTTLGAVVRRSGGSLATLYDEFGSKEYLLRAVVERIREQAMLNLTALDEDRLAPRETLRQVARRFHRYATSTRTLAAMRVVIGASLADPDFGRAFHEDIRVQLVDRVAAALARWSAAGSARITEPAATAELFFAMVLCDAPLKAMLGLPPEETDQDILDRRLQPFFDHFAVAG